MKTTRLLVLAGLLGSFSLAGIAGQTSQLFRPGDKPAAPKSPAPLTCSSCQDESVRAMRFVGPSNRQQVQRIEVARKHSCSACGAAIATALSCPNEKTPGLSCCGRAGS